MKNDYDLENQNFADYVLECIEASGENLCFDDLDSETLQELWNEFIGIKNEKDENYNA